MVYAKLQLGVTQKYDSNATTLLFMWVWGYTKFCKACPFLMLNAPVKKLTCRLVMNPQLRMRRDFHMKKL